MFDMKNEIYRLENDSEYASILWDDTAEQFIIVYWEEWWDKQEINKISYTDFDDESEILEHLWRLGYKEI